MVICFTKLRIYGNLNSIIARKNQDAILIPGFEPQTFYQLFYIKINAFLVKARKQNKKQWSPSLGSQRVYVTLRVLPGKCK